MIPFTLIHPRATAAHLGLIPEFLDERDPRPAAEQFNERYAHGGGWRAFDGFTMGANSIRYPGDQPLALLAEARLRDEVIRVYNGAWVAIVAPNGSYEISRMD